MSIGGDVGSTSIDQDFEQLAAIRLSQLLEVVQLGETANALAWEMRKSRDFQDTKCTFGDPDDSVSYVRIPIPGLDKRYINEELRVYDGQMQFDMSVS